MRTKRRDGRKPNMNPPTIGIGEDKIRGRDDGARLGNEPLGKGELGERIPIRQADADAIARINQDQIIEGGGDDFDDGLFDGING